LQTGIGGSIGVNKRGQVYSVLITLPPMGGGQKVIAGLERWAGLWPDWPLDPPLQTGCRNYSRDIVPHLGPLNSCIIVKRWRRLSDFAVQNLRQTDLLSKHAWSVVISQFKLNVNIRDTLEVN
jgi:hypothetical protein